MSAYKRGLLADMKQAFPSKKGSMVFVLAFDPSIATWSAYMRHGSGLRSKCLEARSIKMLPIAQTCAIARMPFRQCTVAAFAKGNEM
eukprot:3352056-Amphidinium_carterae.1